MTVDFWTEYCFECPSCGDTTRLDYSPRKGEPVKCTTCQKKHKVGEIAEQLHPKEL